MIYVCTYLSQKYFNWSEMQIFISISNKHAFRYNNNRFLIKKKEEKEKQINKTSLDSRSAQ